MTFIESSQKDKDQQQVHSMNQLEKDVVKDSEDEAMEEALAMAVDRLYAITLEL